MFKIRKKIRRKRNYSCPVWREENHLGGGMTGSKVYGTRVHMKMP